MPKIPSGTTRQKKQKFYAVKVGRTPGIYLNWDDAEQQTKHFPGALHKSFKSEDEAQAWIGQSSSAFNSALTVLARQYQSYPSPSRFPMSSKTPSLANTPSTDLLYQFKREASSPNLYATEQVKREPLPTAEWRYQMASSSYIKAETIPSAAEEWDHQMASSSNPKVDTISSPTDLARLSSDSGFLPPQAPPENPATDPNPTPAEPVLSPEQSQILERVLKGDNVYFTGAAGTGKSVLLRAIISNFNQRLGEAETTIAKARADYAAGKGPDPDMQSGASRVIPGKLGVTASTGAAAVNIGGCTLHSWAGIGLGTDTVEKLVVIIRYRPDFLERWTTSQALVIDEISMIDGVLLDKLCLIGQRIRGNQLPFGGLQLILCGDFFQLPPVSKPGNAATFAFDARCWSATIPKRNMLSLTQVYRQKDGGFVQLLESMRKGHCSPEQVRLVQKCDRLVKYEDGGEPVGLYPSKAEVAHINQQRLSALQTQMYQFDAEDETGLDSRGHRITRDRATDILNRNTIWPQELQLKVGAFVMLVTNIGDHRHVNGTTGRVVDFMTAPAAQGAGIPILNKGHPFPPDTKFPVVAFDKSKHASGLYHERVLVTTMSVDSMNANNRPEATRLQVPLILAWALTIHKSQGQTIERLRVDLRRIFESGQTYVALSRAVSLETLEVRNFSKSKIRVNSRVLAWSQSFESGQARPVPASYAKREDSEDETEALLRVAEEMS